MREGIYVINSFISVISNFPIHPAAIWDRSSSGSNCIHHRIKPSCSQSDSCQESGRGGGGAGVRIR